jgi:hypothetical protein
MHFYSDGLEIELYRHFVGVDPLFVLAIFDSQSIGYMSLVVQWYAMWDQICHSIFFVLLVEA